MKSVYLVIAVFCVVPCAFQDVWDEYETWYDDMDDLNHLENDELVGHVDKPEDSPEPVQNNYENKDDYYNENNNDYGDYEVEDNRDEVKPKLEDQEVNQEQELEKNDETAIEDFDTLQRIINNDDTIDEDTIDKILAVDEKIQMDLNDLLSEDVKGDEIVEQNEDIADGGVQQNIDDINEETQQILENTNSEFDEGNGDVKIEPDVETQEEVQEFIEETRKILEDTNKEFDENEVEKQVGKESDQDGAMLEGQDLKDFDDIQQSLGDNNDNIEEVLEEKVNDDEIKNSDEDTVDKVYQDLNADLDKLFETWQKLSDDGDETNTNIENGESTEIKNDQVIPGEVPDQTNEDDSKALNEAGIEALPEIQANIQDIIEETRKILEETNKEFDENKEENQDAMKVVEDQVLIEDPKDVEGSPDELYDDNNLDFEKLIEILKNISSEDDEAEPNTNSEKVQNVFKQILLEVPDDDDKAEIGDEAKEQNNFDYEGESRILQIRNDYYDSILDKDLENIFKEFNNDNEEQNADTNSKESVPILYVNDALIADPEENNQQDADDNKESVANAVEVRAKLNDAPENNEDEFLINKQIPIKQSETEEKSEKLTMNVDELNNSELDELNKQFVILHSSDMIDDGDDTPIHITLNADEPVVVTSPNYPSAYPTDISTIDWILEGQGTGIEVNVTDLEINSAMGHYLLLKPGQSDASGDDGIVFAYRLNNERRYRFRDVNKMLVRFHPVGGMAFSKGFRLSAKIIEPLASDEEDNEEMPEPETLVPEPTETATLLLSGYNATSFESIREEFRVTLAQMATIYINTNDIEHEIEDIFTVTKITRAYACNVNWPEFGACVSVTFGIPVVYENGVNRLTEMELLDMWRTFSVMDPFATKLKRMGISDYNPPRDNYILTIWVLIGVAVLISAAVLAFALWRYSCVENYTRMIDQNDTDSLHEKKRALDMYPTPHQTLPPLFTENEYKWADGTFDDDTRVDMGGFTNNTFTRDDLSESEDETKRDRNSFKPRDFSAA